MARATSWLDPETVERAFRLSALADVVLCETEWLKVHRYDPGWAEGVRCGWLDNGAGDTLHALFSAAGAVVKGFDHESPMSPWARDVFEVWPGMYDDVPPALSALLDDPALERDNVTFCLWRPAGDPTWFQGDVVFPNGEDDGRAYLLGYVHATPKDYAEWASGYYGREVDAAAVARLYRSGIVDPEMVRRLNPDRDPAAVLRELSGETG